MTLLMLFDNLLRLLSEFLSLTRTPITISPGVKCVKMVLFLMLIYIKNGMKKRIVQVIAPTILSTHSPRV